MNGAADRAPELYHLPGFYEPCSAISHLVGAGVFLLLGLLLMRRGRGSRLRLAFLGVYASSCVFLLSMSAVYHMVDRSGTAHRVMERLDHAAIFVLIAGTFTPALGLLYRGRLRVASLAFIWTAAVAGITLKTIFFASLDEWVGLSCYLALGWFGVFIVAHLGLLYGFPFVKPLLVGGVIYSVGALLEFSGWVALIPGVMHPHEVFHLAVLLAAFAHWVFIWQIAGGGARARRQVSEPQFDLEGAGCP